MFILLGYCCLPSIRDDYHVFVGLWFLLFAAYFYDPSPTFSPRIQDFILLRFGLAAVYYLAPSIVGVVIVVVLSLMCSTEARCFFMVTVPFYYLTNLCASADCVFLWTSFLFELYIRLVLHVHFVTTEASKVSCLGFIIRHGLLLFLHRHYH